jgi:hypothetical protein
MKIDGEDIAIVFVNMMLIYYFKRHKFEKTFFHAFSLGNGLNRLQVRLNGLNRFQFATLSDNHCL